MKLSRERAIYLTVLGVGVSALALSQVLFPTAPSSAAGASVDAAASAKGYTIPRPSGNTQPPSSANANTTACPVAEQLRSYHRVHSKDITSIRDVFQTPAALDRSAQVAEKTPVNTPDPVDRFKQEHSLTGVMVANRQGKAIVDGKTLLVGQSLDGFKLMTVTQQVAVFESEAGQVVLRIPETSGQSGGAAKP
ncbi:MAG: hypothetical protein ACM359_00760 [Bacillota bacterium]